MMKTVISIKLKELLEGKGWTIYKLAKETGISYNNLHRIAAGKAKVMSFEVLDNLCKKLDCSPNDLLDFDRTA